jgi:hypothetical protein
MGPGPPGSVIATKSDNQTSASGSALRSQSFESAGDASMLPAAAPQRMQ